MQPEQNPKRANPVIEELKAAGEELKKVQPPKFAVGGEDRGWVTRPATTEGKPAFAKASAGKEKFDLPQKIIEYQKEISQKLSALEKSYQVVKELEKKLGERIELLKRLKNKSIEINKELKEFEEQFTLAKKENSNLLDEVKNKLSEGE